MVQLVKIGSSQGVRIPKLLIEKSPLEGKEQFQIVNNGLLIIPEKEARKGWEQTIEKTISAHA